MLLPDVCNDVRPAVNSDAVTRLLVMSYVTRVHTDDSPHTVRGQTRTSTQAYLLDTDALEFCDPGNLLRS